MGTQGSDDAILSVPSPVTESPSRAPQAYPLHRVGSQTAVYTLGIILGRAFSFLLLPVYTRYLSPADYGIIQLVELTFDVLTLVAGSRIAAGLFHFHEKAATAVEKKTVLSTTMLALAAGYAVVALAAALFASALSHLVFDDATRTTLVRIASVSFLFQGLSIVPLAEIRRREKPVLFVGLTSGKLIVQAGLNVSFLAVMKYGVLSMFLSNLLSSGAMAVWLWIYLIRQTGVRFSAAVLKDLIRFGVPLVATQVATIFTTFGDRFFLRRAVDDTISHHSTAGLAAVGIYALAYQFGFLLAGVAVDPFLSVWLPVRFKLARQKNRDQIFSRAFIMLNVMLVTIAVGIGLFVRDVLGIIATPAFQPASQLVPLLLLAYVIGSWSAAQDTGIMLREKTEFITYANWAAAVVALVGYLFLIPRFFGWGAAWSTLAAFVVRQVIIYEAAQKLWPIRYNWRPVWTLLGIGSALVGLRIIIHIDQRLLSILVSTLLFVVYVFSLWRSGILPKSVRQSVFRGLRSPRVALSSLFLDAT